MESTNRCSSVTLITSIGRQCRKPGENTCCTSLHLWRRVQFLLHDRDVVFHSCSRNAKVTDRLKCLNNCQMVCHAICINTLGLQSYFIASWLFLQCQQQVQIFTYWVELCLHLHNRTGKHFRKDMGVTRLHVHTPWYCHYLIKAKSPNIYLGFIYIYILISKIFIHNNTGDLLNFSSSISQHLAFAHNQIPKQNDIPNSLCKDDNIFHCSS